MTAPAPVDAGLIARTLKAVLSRALGSRRPEISESELSQIARVTVIGHQNRIQLSPGYGAASVPSDDAVISNLVTQCFQLVAREPGLSVVFTVGEKGERILRIDHPASYVVPSEQELYRDASEVLTGTAVELSSPRVPPRTVDPVVYPAGDTPDRLPADTPIQLPPGRPSSGPTWQEESVPVLPPNPTAKDYADYTRRLAEMPDA